MDDKTTALANLWLTEPLVRRRTAATPMGAALTHTTTSPAMLSAGVEDNVLPPVASAVVNFRIAPGETRASVMARVKEIIADTLITVEPTDSARTDCVFRFLALPLAEGDQARLHRVNERIAVRDYAVAVGFFTTLLRGIDAVDD